MCMCQLRYDYVYNQQCNRIVPLAFFGPYISVRLWSNLVAKALFVVDIIATVKVKKGGDDDQ